MMLIRLVATSEQAKGVLGPFLSPNFAFSTPKYWGHHLLLCPACPFNDQMQKNECSKQTVAENQLGDRGWWGTEWWAWTRWPRSLATQIILWFHNDGVFLHPRVCRQWRSHGHTCYFSNQEDGKQKSKEKLDQIILVLHFQLDIRWFDRKRGCDRGTQTSRDAQTFPTAKPTPNPSILAPLLHKTRRKKARWVPRTNSLLPCRLAGWKFSPNLSFSKRKQSQRWASWIIRSVFRHIYIFFPPTSENSTNSQWQCFQNEATVMWKINCWDITPECWNKTR